jgi:hypothetical protein
MRYRRSYAARHTSVSWNLMIGRNALLVAKEHGHRPLTMLTVYAVWTEGAVESDIRAIRTARNPKDRRTIGHPDGTATSASSRWAKISQAFQKLIENMAFPDLPVAKFPLIALALGPAGSAQADAVRQSAD